MLYLVPSPIWAEALDANIKTLTQTLKVARKVALKLEPKEAPKEARTQHAKARPRVDGARGLSVDRLTNR